MTPGEDPRGSSGGAPASPDVREEGPGASSGKEGGRTRGASGPSELPSPPAVARREDDGTSVVPDPTAASALHGRGSYGQVEAGGALRLDPLETVYLAEMQRVRVEGRDGQGEGFRDLLAAASLRDPAFEIRYLVYRDLRQRGYVVLRGPPPVEFSMLPRGGTAGRTASRWWVEARSERTPFALRELVRDLGQVHAARKVLLLGVVDEESDTTYYKVRDVVPHGDAPPPTGPAGAEGVVLEDRVSVFDPETVRRLDEGEHYGSRVGARLELSLLEALFLGGEGRLTLRSPAGGRVEPFEQFAAASLRTEPDLSVRLPVYRHLRTLGLVPKTGFKYGTHFRAYERDPGSTHARYLVHVVPPAWTTAWPEVARGVRLAQGVRKQFLLAFVDGGEGTPPSYLHLERTRP